jgi:ABC-type transport system involved in cytochrome c biogenesis permease component
MKRSFKILQTLLRKEVLLELRGKEVLTLLFVTGITLGALVGAGSSGAVLEYRVLQRIFPTFLWVTFFFSSVLAMTRSHEAELEGRGFEAIVLLGVPGSYQFLAKWVVTTVLMLLSFTVNSVCIALALGQEIGGVFGPLLSVGALAAAGIAPLMVLLGGVASTSRMRGVLLPLLVLPLMFPFFLAGTELTAELILERSISMTSPWVSVLIGADTLFILLGLNLYGFSLRD